MDVTTAATRATRPNIVQQSSPVGSSAGRLLLDRRVEREHAAGMKPAGTTYGAIAFYIILAIIGLAWLSGAFSGSTATEPTSSCNPNYSGCLKSNAGDYDCARGSGNGPNYTGRGRVIGYDEYSLDRDGDGWGCE